MNEGHCLDKIRNVCTNIINDEELLRNIAIILRVEYVDEKTKISAEFDDDKKYIEITYINHKGVGHSLRTNVKIASQIIFILGCNHLDENLLSTVYKYAPPRVQANMMTYIDNNVNKLKLRDDLELWLLMQ